MENAEKIIRELLSATGEALEKADGLPFETASELYDLYEDAVKYAVANRAELDPMLRAQLCDGLDKLLDRIVDDMPPLTLPTNAFGEKFKNIYSPVIHNYRRWYNEELMKDCGLSGYTLGQEFGLNPIMLFGTAAEDYPYLEILPKMKMLYTDDPPGVDETYFKHLLENAREMDVLILYGKYIEALAYLDVYRTFRPDGKVYCALDMNSDWMRKYSWGIEESVKFASQCDVIATSCRAIRDALNSNPKVAFPCRWLPNGFYNSTGLPVKAEALAKEKIILTVGRIGTAQKRSEELIKAFLGVLESLPGWTLRLVGPIEPEFRQMIAENVEKFPKMMKRVVFTDAITDKAELYREYARASIFALSSVFEGGTPNVYAEALFHGCMFVTSDVDAFEDMTNFGELGVTYKSGDIAGLAGALVDLCARVDNGELEQHIPKALAYANRYYDWKRNAKKLGYMLFRN